MPVILVSGNLKSNKGFEFVEKPSLPATLMIVVRTLASTVGHKAASLMGPAMQGAFG